MTTEGGLDVAGNLAALTETRKRMNDAGIEVSLFIAPDPQQIEASARTGSQFVELHTGAFADSFAEEKAREIELGRLIDGARQAHGLGLRVNAGHGLNYQNLPTIHRVPHLVELNIGHSIIARAVLESGGKTLLIDTPPELRLQLVAAGKVRFGGGWRRSGRRGRPEEPASGSGGQLPAPSLSTS